MSASTKSIRIGIVAEDQSDIDVFYAILEKYIKSNRFTISKALGEGKSRILGKPEKYISILQNKAADLIIVCIDRDRECEKKIAATIKPHLDKIAKAPALVLVPTEAVEAWLLSDQEALKSVFGLKKNVKIPSVEGIPDPKRFLYEMVKTESGKKYLDTLHNRRIASAISCKSLENCSSFKPFLSFIQSNVESSDRV